MPLRSAPTTLAISLLLTALIGLFAAVGCADDMATGCADDTDCRFGRQCISGICLGGVDGVRDGDGGGQTNNATNNATSDAGLPPDAAPDTDAGAGPNVDPPIGRCDEDGAACPPNSVCVEGNCAVVCSSASDCDGAQVCAPSDEQDPSTPAVCVDPWDCPTESFSSEGQSFCGAQYNCEDARILVICEGSDPGGLCSCVVDFPDRALMQEVPFMVETLVCEEGHPSFLDGANLNCGTRLPIER